jgi:hypothetical protein
MSTPTPSSEDDIVAPSIHGLHSQSATGYSPRNPLEIEELMIMEGPETLFESNPGTAPRD